MYYVCTNHFHLFVVINVAHHDFKRLFVYLNVSNAITFVLGDGNIWQINPPATQQQLIQTQQQLANECCDLLKGEAMTCQELLALGAINAALPTGQIALDTFLGSLSKGVAHRNPDELYLQQLPEDDFSCCQDMWHCESEHITARRSRCYVIVCTVLKFIIRYIH